MRTYAFKLTLLLLLTAGLIPFNGAAQNTNMPSDFGTVVNGFQDNFTNSTLNPAWVAVGFGGYQYSETNDVLSVGTFAASSLPGSGQNHLLYIPGGGYDSSTQEVLIRIRILDMPLEDANYCRAGEVVGAEPPGEGLIYGITNTGCGVNWMLMNLNDAAAIREDDLNGPQARSLYDGIAWGPGYTNADIPWQPYTWYWMRLHLDGLSTQGGTYDNMWGKVWLGDGSEAEPTNWQYMDAYDLSAATGTGVTNGLAGITAGGGGGVDDFEVNYFLLKAAGLPSITVNPVLDPLYLNEQPVSTLGWLGVTASFSVTAVSLGSAPNYQWQIASSGSSNFTDISGATSSTYTTPTLTSGDNGTSYRVVVSITSPSAQVISTNAVLTVQASPTLMIYAKTLGQTNQVTLLFSEPVSVPSGVSGFAINSGASVTAVTQGVNTSALILTTTGLTLGGSYTLTINGVQSTFGAPLAANTQAAIDFTVQVPYEYGQVVSGFQDSFTEATMNTNWVIYAGSGGVLISPPPGDLSSLVVQSNDNLYIGSPPAADGYDPVHLVYAPPTPYNSTNQEVLARIMVTSYPDNDYARPGVCVAAQDSDAWAIDWMLGNGLPGLSGAGLALLEDDIAWGPAEPYEWALNTWYWLRLSQVDNTAFAKVWPADGATPEPADWQVTWDYTSSGNEFGFSVQGYAGLEISDSGGTCAFQVSYVLIEAAGLSNVLVSAANIFPFTFPTLALTQTSPGSLTLQWSGSATLQTAPDVTGPWIDVLGATSPYTTNTTATAAFFRVKQ